MPLSYDMLKERYPAQMLYYVNKNRLAYIAMCIQWGLDTLLNLAFKSIFEACEQKHGSCHVYDSVISESYISRLTQDLEYILRVPIRNTTIKSGQD